LRTRLNINGIKANTETKTLSFWLMKKKATPSPNYLYLPGKALLQEKLAEWVEEFEEAHRDITAAKSKKST